MGSDTFATMGTIYFCFMMFGVLTVRVSADGWLPAGYVPPRQPKKLVTNAHVDADTAIKTPQFWFEHVWRRVRDNSGILDGKNHYRGAH